MKNFILLLFSLLLSVGFGEGLFRIVERVFLIHTFEEKLPSYPLGDLGYKEGTIPSEKSENEYRILAIGDSFTYAILPDQFTYVRLLEDRLNAAEGERRYRVINLGVPATQIQNYIDRYKFWKERIDYDHVLFFIYTGNDLSPTMGQFDESTVNQSLKFGPALKIPHKFPLRMLDYGYAFVAQSFMASRKPLPADMNSESLGMPEEDYDKLMRNGSRHYFEQNLQSDQSGYYYLLKLIQLTKEIRANGKAAAIYLQPPEFLIDNERFAKTMRGTDLSSFSDAQPYHVALALAEESQSDAPIFDMTPAFLASARQDKKTLYAKRDTHWNKAGNEIAADFIAQTIQDPENKGADAYRYPRRSKKIDDFARKLFAWSTNTRSLSILEDIRNSRDNAEEVFAKHNLQRNSRDYRGLIYHIGRYRIGDIFMDREYKTFTIEGNVSRNNFSETLFFIATKDGKFSSFGSLDGTEGGDKSERVLIPISLNLENHASEIADLEVYGFNEREFFQLRKHEDLLNMFKSEFMTDWGKMKNKNE